MTEKTVSLWSFNDAMSAMSLPGREAMLERTFALQIGGKLNYKDVFENTPEALVASIVRQFNFWYNGLSPQEQWTLVKQEDSGSDGVVTLRRSYF